MIHRQSLPRQWLVADERLGEGLIRTVRALPAGTGILFLYRQRPKADRARLLARLRRLARGRGILIVDEAAGEAARVHDLRELRAAQLRGVRIILLSPMFPTRSHPAWEPLPRMKAAAIVRLAREPIIALGGMNERRFRRIARLGFSGWAGIDAYGP
jgi:thiamine-phosphate pyrophosphorylase